jgi:hypothetical protein
MTSGSHNPFFKDPHSHSEPLGTLTCRAHFVTSKEFPNTCAACSNLANTWDHDNQSFRKGTDNYTPTLEKLLQMLDVFIREKSKNAVTGGQQQNYSLSDNCEKTILLLWQIRNVMAHNGAVIDENCKTNYGKIFRKKRDATHLIIELPETLEVGQEFIIHKTDFEKVKDCVFNYIKQRVSDEDFSIFARRATTANFQIVGGFAYYPWIDGKLVFSIRKADAYGVKINPKTGMLDYPQGITFSFNESRIYLKNGDSFPAQYISNSEFDERKLPDLDF